jgi:hypothetical protein
MIWSLGLKMDSQHMPYPASYLLLSLIELSIYFFNFLRMSLIELTTRNLLTVFFFHYIIFAKAFMPKSTELPLFLGITLMLLVLEADSNDTAVVSR